MLNRLIIIKEIPLAAVLLFCSCTSRKNNSVVVVAKEPLYKAMVVQRSKQDSAWGYIILHNNRQMIRQFSIPAMNGNKAFDSEQQAAAVGELVAEKLNHAQRPGISKHELDSLGIIQLTHATQEK
jgi:hypothetical protein